jgi:L-histidine N-alpha-methyltransferase
MLDEVCESLSRPRKELSPKFFYDARGSELFEEITRLPEYYLTRAEREILERHAPEIAADSRARTLVELGAGSAAKTRILLDALRAAGTEVSYVPIDVSAEFLERTATALRAEYRGLVVEPVVADISVDLAVRTRRTGPALFALLGSTIGNFDMSAARDLLRRVRDAMCPGDHFLLGADLRKAKATLEAAYDDSAGVTAEFNRNILHVLNAELGADFVPWAFRHRAVYNDAEHRIEMHLDAIGPQVVHIPGMPPVTFRDGESIMTEISCKYDRESVEALCASADLEIERWFTDAADRFALALLRPAS